MWDQRTIAYGLEREKLFASAVAVEVDDANRIFVADYGRSRIQVYRKLPAVFLGTHLGHSRATVYVPFEALPSRIDSMAGSAKLLY